MVVEEILNFGLLEEPIWKNLPLFLFNSYSRNFLYASRIFLYIYILGSGRIKVGRGVYHWQGDIHLPSAACLRLTFASRPPMSFFAAIYSIDAIFSLLFKKKKNRGLSEYVYFLYER